VHGSVVALAITAVVRDWVGAPFLPVLSLLIGASFAGLTFLGHETLHGAVVRNRVVRHVVGFIGFLPFTISPTLWVAWHNRVHHGNTNHAELDPDAYPTLDAYKQSRAIRVAIELAPGRSRWTFALALCVALSVQGAQVLLRARRPGYLSNRAYVQAWLETVLGWAIWGSLAVYGGVTALVFAYLLPLFVANAIVMAFIFTNHSLSPLTAKNDALLNSLSVTLPAWLEWLTLRFGYHVEHHIYPSMSSRHAPEVRALLLRDWPERYQSMPLIRALTEIHRSARVYNTSSTLIEPRSGREWQTLMPRAVPDLPKRMAS